MWVPVGKNVSFSENLAYVLNQTRFCVKNLKWLRFFFALVFFMYNSISEFNLELLRI